MTMAKTTSADVIRLISECAVFTAVDVQNILLAMEFRQACTPLNSWARREIATALHVASRVVSDAACQDKSGVFTKEQMK